MSCQGLERCGSDAVSHVDFTVPSTPADQQGGFITQILNEADIPHRPVMHCQLDFRGRAYLLLSIQIIYPDQLHGFVVAPCRKQIPIRGPAQTVN